MRPSIMIAAALCRRPVRAGARPQDAYVVGITAALTGPPGFNLRAGGRGAAHLSRPRQRGGRRQRQEGQARHRGRFGAAVEGRRQRQEIADRGQSGADAQRQPLLHLCAGHRRSQDRRRAADVRKLGLPEGRLSAGAAEGEFCTTAFAATYDSRAALAFVKETAKDPVKIGFSAMAIPLSRGEMDFAESQAAGARHDAGRQGGHPAADRRLHAVRDQAQGRRRELGVLLGTVGDAGAHLRSFAPPRLVGRLHHLGPSRGRGRTQAHQGREALRHRRQRAVRRRAADPEGDRRSREAGRRQISARTR